MDPGGAIAPAVYLGCLRLPPRGYGKDATPTPTLGCGNAPSSLARRLAAGHAAKNAHDADKWRKWGRDRILAASETVGVGYRDGSPKAAKIIDRTRVPGPGADASSTFEPDCQRVGGSFR
jgi:hypothetical protein